MSEIDKYIEAATKMATLREQAMKKMRSCRFDTIAVHGLYTMNESLNFNQGVISYCRKACST